MCANDDVKSLIKEKISNILHEDFARVLPEYHEINTENWGPQNGYYQNEELDNIFYLLFNLLQHNIVFFVKLKLFFTATFDASDDGFMEQA